MQRIINASVHTNTGASPASPLFGNKVMLDKGILLPPPEVPRTLIPASTKVADMILIQDTLMAQAATRLRTVDDANLATHSVAITTFTVYSSTPPTRLHAKWEGPFKVIFSHLSEYALLNLVSKKTRIVHASRLKTFLFDPPTQDPMDTARRDSMEFFVESILAHAGDCRRVSTLTFHVKWLNHPSSANTWEPWRNLRS
jgi:Chromo (CHRromatin Organisation MOdifier) domain